jgi:hypothetical protein
MLGYNYVVDVGTYLYSVGAKFNLTSVSGTSASAPVFAGVLALVNSARLSKGLGSVGWATPTLYQLHALQPSIFNDVTEGSNNCASADNAAKAVCLEQGFSASAGWDPVTGLGSVNVGLLVDAWGSYATPTPQPTVSTTPAPTTIDTFSLSCVVEIYAGTKYEASGNSPSVLTGVVASQLGINATDVTDLAVELNFAKLAGENDDNTVMYYSWYVSFTVSSSLQAVGQQTLADWGDAAKASLSTGAFASQLSTQLDAPLVVLAAFAVPYGNTRTSATRAPTVSAPPTMMPSSMPSMAPTPFVSSAPTASDEVVIDALLYMYVSQPVNNARINALKAAIASTLNVPSLRIHDFNFASTMLTSSQFDWRTSGPAMVGNFSVFRVSAFLSR